MSTLVSVTERGLHCAAGDFYIDPWKPVDRAVITHAHADHARAGHAHYLHTHAGVRVLGARVGGQGASIQALEYGETLRIGTARVSLHPAGHVLGSAQVRIEVNGEVWVVSGDYKLEPDATCAPFEPLRCDVFISESTFGLPIYRWHPHSELFAAINAWWQGNQREGKASVLYAYAFGKAQRILAGVDASIGPIVVHGAIEPLNAAYRESGVALPATLRVSEIERDFDFSSALVIAPPSAQGTPWLKRFGDFSDAFASGWMAIRGTRRRRAFDTGFALSDHADWPGLLESIRATGAQRVLVTHGYSAVLVRYLREQGLDADTLETQFEGEGIEESVDAGARSEE